MEGGRCSPTSYPTLLVSDVGCIVSRAATELLWASCCVCRAVPAPPYKGLRVCACQSSPHVSGACDCDRVGVGGVPCVCCWRKESDEHQSWGAGSDAGEGILACAVLLPVNVRRNWKRECSHEI